MEATIYDTEGESVDSIELPAIFETGYRPDLIQRAVVAAQSHRSQPYGADPFAGKRTSAVSPGAGTGRAMVPRSNNRGRRVPQAIGGRRAHPPKATKDRGIDVNDQERQLATRSAIAATAHAERVTERGHAIGEDTAVPVVVADDFESLSKTKEVVGLLEALELYGDIERAEEGKHIRAGRGKRRGRKYKSPKSILFVTSSDAGPSRAARNLAGADVATADEVSVEELAPGGDAGRLTIWTAAAIEEVADR